jgi:hypothetical protein
MNGTLAMSKKRRETAILEQLMRRLGRVVPKAILEAKLYGIDDEHESRCGRWSGGHGCGDLNRGAQHCTLSWAPNKR